MAEYDAALDRWAESVPDPIRRDPLWRMRVYRLALFASDRGWTNVEALHGDRRTRAMADQLARALGSVSANIAEGYSRGSGRDRARFYEYALGSAREARDWTYQGRHTIGTGQAERHVALLSEIVRQLLVIVQRQPGRRLREPTADYDAHTPPPSGGATEPAPNTQPAPRHS